MKKCPTLNRILFTLLFSFSGLVHSTETIERTVNTNAIIMFLIFVASTLLITYWASKRTKSANEFYAAGNQISALQNGLAVAGDYISAATFLGFTALAFLVGFDVLFYTLGATVAWVIVFFLVAERLRNLGRYTFADAAAYRLDRVPIRTLATAGTLVVVIPYLLAQMVGAGALVQSLFNIPYVLAVCIVGGLMMLYVTFGGMLATTWVQIIKAVLLLTGGTIMAIYVMYQFGFSFDALSREAISIHSKGENIMHPGGKFKDTWGALSLGMSLVFGTAGLPHILMRFFTVPSGKVARKSAVYAMCFIGFFMSIVIIIGFGAVVFVTGKPEFLDTNGDLIGGANLAAIHLSYVIGGDYFLGFISAVAFATILAVVSGLSLSAASAVSHDLYATVFRNGKASEKEEITVSRITVIVIGVITILLAILFEKESIAFLAILALAIAASVNLPVLVLSMYWRDITTRGAVYGGAIGLLSAIILIVLSPTIWVKILGYEEAIFPYGYPTIISMPVSFLAIYIISLLDNSARAKRERKAYAVQTVRSELGSL